ncbi:MAG: hypothetical protein JXA08_00120 [Methanomicrobiaceae archaeon]|nr:hypothetical protein [Methanomicrobiaceae archaeon]
MMKRKRILSPITLMLAGMVCCAGLLLFSCGCCEAVGVTVEKPAKQPAAPPLSEEQAAAPTPDPCIPQPTDAVPAGYEVETGISKEPITGDITVRVNGGKGISLMEIMYVTVVHPDGSSSQTAMSKPKVNDEVTLRGTKDGSDRVKIEKRYLNGQTYTTDDTLVAGRELRTGGQGGGGGGGGC